MKELMIAGTVVLLIIFIAGIRWYVKRTIRQQIADYQDALAKGNDCLYQYGRARMEQEDYEGASEAFRKIPDYLDSLGQAEICDYHRAVQLMEQQAYDAAAPLLESAGQYADAAELLQQCR